MALCGQDEVGGQRRGMRHPGDWAMSTLAGWRRGDLAHARRSIQPSRETRSARALPILGMRAPSPLPSNLTGIDTIELYLQLQRVALTALARPEIPITNNK